jgi:hypothetical protein
MRAPSPGRGMLLTPPLVQPSAFHNTIAKYRCFFDEKVNFSDGARRTSSNLVAARLVPARNVSLGAYRVENPEKREEQPQKVTSSSVH